MKTGPVLASWLADPAQQRQSRERVDALTLATAGHPLLLELRRELSALEVKSAENVRAIAERFITRTDEIDALFAVIAAEARAEPYLRPPFPRVVTDIAAALLLLDEPTLMITLDVISVDALAASKLSDRGGTSITFTGVPMLYHFIKSGGLTLSLWEADPITPDFVGERSGRCRQIGTRTMCDGETLYIDGRYQSFIMEHACSDIVHVHASVRAESAPLRVEYDSKTHEFVGASSTDEASSRIQMMITALRMMDRADAMPLIADALQSPHFYTRWHVMREMLAIDAEAALPHLRRLADADPHPEVRAAAQNTLDSFFAGEAAHESEPCLV